MRSLAIALILVTAAATVLLMLATASHAEIFNYVDKYGTFSFTDDIKRIPPVYKDVAQKFVLGGEFKDFDRLTIVTVFRPEKTLLDGQVVSNATARLEHLRALNENPVSVLNEPCTGPITVTSERRQFGDFNRTVYLVHDECGNLVSETFSQPEVNIQR